MALAAQANALYNQAYRLEAEIDAAGLKVGMTVYLRAIPMSWLFSRDHIDGTMPLRVVKLGRVNATVERIDGGEFPYPKRTYKRVIERRVNLSIKARG